MASSGIDIICRSVEGNTGPVHVHGATLAAQALIVSRLRGASCQVVICADEDTATAFEEDLRILSRGVDGCELTVRFFPGWEQSPFSPIAPSIRARLSRVGVLNQLHSAHVPNVIVTTLPAFCQAGIPASVFLEHSVTLCAGESVGSREELMQRLIDGGYLRVDPVEDPGTFAARGEIIDVFPPGRERPVRIELFDDIVEKLREFDPATQRTRVSPEGEGAEDAAAKIELRLPPARETLINSQTAPRIRERLKARADDLGIPRATRDPVLSAIHPGSFPDHSDAWAGFAYDAPSTLLDHLPVGCRIAWVDEFSCQQLWAEHLSEQRRLSLGEGHPASAANLILPSVEEIFPWQGELARKLQDRSGLFLDGVELTSPPRGDGATSIQYKVDIQLPDIPGRGARQPLSTLEGQLKSWLKEGFKILVVASMQSQLERTRFLMEERGIACRPEEKQKPRPPWIPGLISFELGSLSRGMIWPAEGLVVLTESEILGARPKPKQPKRLEVESGSAAQDWSGLQSLSDLAPGDAVVHVDHGIGRYQGLVRLSLSGAPSDFLQLEYAGKDKLYLPVYRLNVVQKYVGAGESVQLDRLGAQLFSKAKEKVRDAVKLLAIDLVRLYAERKLRPGTQFGPRDALYREFEEGFPYEETPDQLKAIEQVQADLESGRSMDRLICGDVGYGKTEVAIRAAFRAVSEGKQVAVLVPTTVLAFQHEQNFKARLKDYPILVESLSRFKTTSEQRRILRDTAQGKVDILIGTHRLLSKDIEFRDLGLIVVDEEHRFGVEHKEKLKALKVDTHVLTLTATPIPRTLHMALSGLRDISLINTPPVDRQPIRTFVSTFDEALIQRAIDFELSRGGQVFYLHNRVQSIDKVATTVRGLCPRARVGVGHGQMPEGALEDVMMDFYKNTLNVLVCTTIIESGLDFPSANTIVIDRADSLGLAQLYQIRGRVGRGQNRAYAYLLIPEDIGVTADAKRRLEVIQRFVELGSGFSIASHDLEIRGGGDLLGAQQSGHIAAVGFDLYTTLLEEAILGLQAQGLGDATRPSRKEPEIKAPFPAYLGEEYLPDIHQRLSLYRRFSAAGSDQEVDRLEEELRDRFGPPPEEARNLLWMIRIKVLLKQVGIETLTVGPEKVALTTGADSLLSPAQAVALMASDPARYQLMPDSRFVAALPTATLRDLFFGLEGLLGKLRGPRARLIPTS